MFPENDEIKAGNGRNFMPLLKKVAALFCLILVLAVSAGLAMSMDPEENYRKPRLEKMKVGDWAEYIITVKIGAPLNSSLSKTRRITITNVDRTAVTFKQEDTSEGKTTSSESVLKFTDLTKPIDPKAMRQQASGNEVTTENGHDYDCSWFEQNITTTMSGQPASILDKTWYCEDVPLFGQVRRIFTATTQTVTITTESLKSFGPAH